MAEKAVLRSSKHHHTINQVDNGFAQTMAGLADAYRSEMQQARQEALDQSQNAIENRAIAERYATTTVLVGTQAVQEVLAYNGLVEARWSTIG